MDDLSVPRDENIILPSDVMGSSAVLGTNHLEFEAFVPPNGTAVLRGLVYGRCSRRSASAPGILLL